MQWSFTSNLKHERILRNLNAVVIHNNNTDWDNSNLLIIKVIVTLLQLLHSNYSHHEA